MPWDPSAGPSEWDLLARDFLALVRRPPQGCNLSDAVRQLLLGRPVFLNFVRHQARAALARASARDEWLDDVQQETLQDLASQLERQPDLGIDLAMAEHTFYSWLETIVRRRCGVIVARFIRLESCKSQLVGETVEGQRQQIEARIDVSQAIEKLDEPERSVLLLFHEGHSVRDVAKRLHMPYARAYAAKRRGFKQLRRSLMNYRPEGAPRAEPPHSRGDGNG